jgi:hypothetical protein
MPGRMRLLFLGESALEADHLASLQHWRWGHVPWALCCVNFRHALWRSCSVNILELGNF